MKRGWVLLGVAAAVAGVLAAGPVIAAAAPPGPEASGEKSDAQCYGHHREEGFRSMDLFPEVITEVAAGSTFEWRLTIRNPWLHEILNVFAFVNTSKAPGIEFPGARDPQPFSNAGSLQLNPTAPSRATFPIEVEANATSILARLAGDMGPLSNGDFDLFIRSPAGKVFNLTPDAWSPRRAVGPETLVVPYGEILQGGTGTWTAEVVYASGTLPDAAYEVAGAVYYNLSRSTELAIPGPALLRSGETHTFTFTLIAKEASPQVNMVYGGMAIAHNEHTDPNAQDFGNYTKWATMSYPIGAQNLIGSAVPIDAGSALLALGPTMRAWGEVLGFSASFVLVPAIVLGGVFGRGSITALNRAFGGARQRVLFHNSASYGLLAFSIAHVVVLLLEPVWAWTHGLLLGGLALACMIGLAFTGAFQRRLVVLWGFPRWRFVHFALGVLVLFFVVAHLVVDGTHVEFVRQWLGRPPA